MILEVGFGLGISAAFIQSAKPAHHIIIEANNQVVERAMIFAREAKCRVTVLEGFWEDVIDEIEDASLDGILFDTYPLVEEELYQNHLPFLPFAYRKLRRGGVLTYYSDEAMDFGETHMRKLLSAGFEFTNISGKVVRVEPPEDCDYWKANSMLAPIVRK